MRYIAKPYEDQSVGTIADILLRSGQLQANQQQRLAEIAANLQLAQGQAAANRATGGNVWGGMLGNLGQFAGNVGTLAMKTPQTPTPTPGGASGGAGGGAVYGPPMPGLTWNTDPTLGTGRR